MLSGTVEPVLTHWKGGQCNRETEFYLILIILNSNLNSFKLHRAELLSRA